MDELVETLERNELLNVTCLLCLLWAVNQPVDQRTVSSIDRLFILQQPVIYLDASLFDGSQTTALSIQLANDHVF